MNRSMDWRGLENSLRTEARFFSRTAANYLTSIFDGVDGMQTREGRPLVVDAGPGTDFHTLYRARVFQSDGKLETALGRPDNHLASPPSLLATAGYMNARGISVFYGANNQNAAIAEVRPPVGSRVAVAQFEIIRTLRLLDLAALGHISVTDGLADFGLAERLESAMFMRSLSKHITRPAMPDDEPLGYVATQAIVDFLATDTSVPIDGIMFPSVQAARDALNVILFHKAARVESMNVPEETEISVSTGRWTEDGWVEEYEVHELAPPVSNNIEQDLGWPDLDVIAEATPPDSRGADWREESLRIVPESVRVHRVKRVEFTTDEFTVKRLYREKQTSVDSWTGR